MYQNTTCHHINAGINFNTRDVWGVAVVVLVVSLSSAGIIFNTRDVIE